MRLQNTLEIIVILQIESKIKSVTIYILGNSKIPRSYSTFL